MKTLMVILTVILIGMESSSYCQNLFVENFNYPVLESLDNIGDWRLESVNTPYKVSIKNPGLNYSGYLGSGIGNCASIYCHDDGNIYYKTISSRNSGSVYLSYLFRVDSLSASATHGYNICLDESDGATNLNTKTTIKRLTSSTFNFGMMKSDETPVFSSNVYNANTTYLVVVKYTFVAAGSNNDSAKLFVFSSGVPSSEPAVPLISSVSGIDIDDIGEVAITNSFAAYGLQGSSLKIDGIRIGTSWSNTLLTNVNLQLNLTGLIEGLYNPVSNKMVKDTARVYLRFNTAPYSIADSSKAVLDSAGKAAFLFNRISNYTPFYITVKHRNSIETWSSTGKIFTNNLLNYDFTDHVTRAYGNNLIIRGTKYCIYSGDVNKDGVVEAADLAMVDNAAFNFLTGYVNTDINGDGTVDASDAVYVDNNSFNFVGKVTP